MRTPVLVLDEPTTGQDERGLAVVGRSIDAVAAEGRTVIAISHDMRFVAERFERIVVMREGRIVLDGPPASAFARESWETLRSTFVEPPLAALVGDRLALGSTPTDDDLVRALSRRAPPKQA
jgi:energy-coupling factor transport system ATP-binding protein